MQKQRTQFTTQVDNGLFGVFSLKTQMNITFFNNLK